MRTLVDDQLRDEVRACGLRFTCEACRSFDPGSATCAYGYPTEEHREKDLAGCREIVFCKAFELA